MTASVHGPVIAVRGLSIVRGDVTILRNVNWTVRRGEHWAILGGNGSGKTSLLRALTAYFMPSAGEIEVQGEIYGKADWSKLRRHIGFVSTSAAQRIPADETALETVLSGMKAQLGYWVRRTKEADSRKALGCLRQVGCAGLKNRAWQLLSQGERQRVFIARALISQPSILILDEPCAGLDPVMREVFLSLVSELALRPAAPTLVLVTHHVEEILPVFTHSLLLKKGRVLAQGATEEMLTGSLLSQVFGARMRVECDKAGRWRMHMIQE